MVRLLRFKLSRTQQGYCLLTATMIMVASTVIVSKIISAGMPVFTATVLRFAIATPVLYLLLRYFGQNLLVLHTFKRHDLALLGVQALAGSVGYPVLLLLGMQFTSAGNGGIVGGILPIMTGLLAITLFGERPSRRLFIAIFCAALGVFIITVQPSMGGLQLPSINDAIGIALLLAAIACESLFLLLNKKLSVPLATLPLAFLMSSGGLVFNALPALLELYIGQFTFNYAALAGVIYYALIPTVLGLLFWYEGASRTTASEAALFTAVFPVATVILAYLVLGKSISIQQSIGVACVMLAIVIGVKSTRARS